MSADGEINVRVNAEGAGEAADELADQNGAGGGVAAGGRGGGGGGGLTGALKGAGILSLLGTALELLGPVGDFLDAIFSILKAFLAPIGLIIFRLLSPVLRLLVKALPVWLSFMSAVDGHVEGLMNWFETTGMDLWRGILNVPPRLWGLMQSGWSWLSNGAVAVGSEVWAALNSGAAWLSNGAVAVGSAVWSKLSSGASWLADGATNIGSSVWTAISNGASWFANGAQSIGSAVWSFMKRLPELIGQEIASRLPSIPGGGDVQDAAQGAFQGARETASGIGNAVAVNISGGLGSFVDNVESDQSVDF